MSQLEIWFPALTSTGLFAGALWIGRELISTRLTNTVKHEFDKKLELLRSDLKFKDEQIASLRSAAMSGLMNRQGILFQRKLEAIDQVWESITELQKAKHISQTVSIINYEYCAKEAVLDPKFREFAELMGGNFDPNNINFKSAQKAKPFLTKLAWAYYSAYQAIITSAIVKMHFLKMGIKDSQKMLNIESTNKLLKSVLPHLSEYIDSNDSSVHHFLLDQIEELLLSELSNIQNGTDADKDNAIRASEIIKAVEELSSATAAGIPPSA